MTGRYREQFKDLIDSLASRSDIIVHRAELGAPASENALATARTYAAYQLPRGVEEFYRECNGVHLEWELKGSVAVGQEPDRGAIRLLPVERIFGSWKGVIWFDDFPGGERFRPIKPFDFFESEACMAFFQEPDETPHDEVHLHYVGEDTCSTHFSFPDYLDRLITARGYLYWQLTLCPDTQANAQVHLFQTRMPILFPDFSPSAFVPRSTGS